MPVAKKPRATEELTPAALGYLRALRVAADDGEATEAESGALHGLFLEACARYGLDGRTMAACIEVLL